MPYITPQRKHDLLTERPQTAGELNYVLTTTVNDYLRDQTLYSGSVTYTWLNEIIGALESAKQEFYRRVVVPYEDKKLAENGDVYGI